MAGAHTLDHRRVTLSDPHIKNQTGGVRECVEQWLEVRFRAVLGPPIRGNEQDPQRLDRCVSRARV